MNLPRAIALVRARLHRYARHHPKRAMLLTFALDAGYATVVGMNVQHIGPR